MNQKTDLFSEPIVVGVDDSPTARHALQVALDLAGALGTRVVVVSAYRRLHDSKLKAVRRDAPPDLAWRLQGDSAVQSVLEDARDQASDSGAAVECIAREGSVAEVIVGLASEIGAGLVIIGNRELRGRNRRKGDVAGEISRRAPCSVLIVDTARAAAA